MSLYSDPTREEIEEEIEKSMIFIGVCKHLWVADLNLPSEEFDKKLMEATEKAEHVAKGDDKADAIMAEQHKKMLKHLMSGLVRECDFDENDKHAYN